MSDKKKHSRDENTSGGRFFSLTRSVLSNLKLRKAPDEESYFSNVKPKILFFVLAAICVAFIALSLTVDGFTTPFKSAANAIIVPIQKGINSIGTRISEEIQKSNDLEALNEENEQLRQQLSALEERNDTLEQYEVTIGELETLLELKNTYSDYETIAAQVIAKNSDRWFSTFTINKGSADGIAVDMNIIADGGLVGIVTDVGQNFATCRSITYDGNNVSGMLSGTSEICVVTGSLSLMDQNLLAFSDLTASATVAEGMAIVTSNVSSKYLPNMTIGYISSYEIDGNGLTVSGQITPAVDFDSLNYVLVITTLKETSD